ncbi:MAG TPA: aminomethyl-transferring glycine dehydrogenase subunit GcvPB [Planctomycetota bacterium]|nr:aminomethyl-transferring glycine dehydrogenase subunit GcvPB [Planctomycetota bacterium]
MRTISEPPIFELADDEHPGFPAVGPNRVVDAVEADLPLRRDRCGGFSQVDEIDVVRHYTRLSNLNFDINRGMYPLGSCTMKHNPLLNEKVAADPHFAHCHPTWPAKYLKAHREVMAELARDLAEVSGFDEVCLQPAAGAHGELTAIFMIKAYFDARGEGATRKTVLIPDTAHGTNPASAAMAGFVCKQIASGPEGMLRLEDVLPHLDGTVAAIMVTNPNTLGVYERDFTRIADAVHRAGGLVYMDGANFNAVMGVFQAGRIGADVMHFNLHKTFTTPHGGGGPGSGPIGYVKALAPFAPGSGAPESIGPVKAYFGQWGMFIRAWCYIRALGGVGLREASEQAILNANYLRKHLEPSLNMPCRTATLHEAVFNDRNVPNGVTTGDLAKRLIDYGFHPPTVYFPIMVRGALMIEPTETEPRRELDRFIAAVKCVLDEAAREPEMVKAAPHTTPVRRVDDVRAARRLDLRWTPATDARSS